MVIEDFESSKGERNCEEAERWDKLEGAVEMNEEKGICEIFKDDEDLD